MKLLYLVTHAVHGHDYGVDWLYHGLRQLPDVEVWDWPQKASLHCSIKNGQITRDECQIDSDQAWPQRDYLLSGVAESADVAVLAVSFPLEGRTLELLRNACMTLPSRTPIVALDYSDIIADMRPQYRELAGRPLIAYFKRELPLGADWGIPMPMCYPEIPVDWSAKEHRLFYHATDHGGGAPGIPRRRIVARLRKECRGDQLDIALYPSQQSRPTPEEYHERMRQALLGISYNCAPNWDCNRHWENLAYGLAQIAERPRIQIPDAPVDRTHCLYVDSPDDVPSLVASLLAKRPLVDTLAQSGYAHFCRHHSSLARAWYFVDHLRRVL